MTVVFSDALGDLRTWLRKHPDLRPLHGARVFFSLPKPTEVSGYPIMRLYRSGGGVQAGEAPLQDLRLGVEVWGGKFGDYPAVRQLVAATESAFHNLQNQVIGGTCLQFAQVTTAFDSPDPSSGNPRYILDVLVTCRATGSGDNA